jgi:hypothetical protein
MEKVAVDVLFVVPTTSSLRCVASAVHIAGAKVAHGSTRRPRQAAVLVERGLTAEAVETVSVAESYAGARGNELTGD